MSAFASLFNLEWADLIVIFIIILLLFGAKKLPEWARGLGQAIAEFRRAKDEFEENGEELPVRESVPWPSNGALLTALLLVIVLALLLGGE